MPSRERRTSSIRLMQVAAGTIAAVLVTTLALGCGSRKQPATQTTIVSTAPASDRDEVFMLTASLGPALSSDCVAPDAPPAARVSLQQAIDAVRRQLENQPSSGLQGSVWNFERADAQVVLCRSAAAVGEPRPYWFVVVPAPTGLSRCGPVADPATKMGATCWSETAALFVDAVDGSAGGASISGRQGPSMTETQLGAAHRYAVRYGWWELWKLFRGYSGQALPADVLTELDRATR